LMTHEDVQKDKMGIMGHSEGGMITPIVASRKVRGKENLTAIKKAFKDSGNKKLKTKTYKNLNHLFQKTKTYKNLNHLFQTSETGEGNEYAINQETFNIQVMEDVLKWMERL